MDCTKRTIRLGEEYDEQLRDVLMTVLKDLGAVVDERRWGVAGSQELETLSVGLGEQSLVVEAETYIGLSITGEETLVDEVARRVAAVLPLASVTYPRSRGHAVAQDGSSNAVTTIDPARFDAAARIVSEFAGEHAAGPFSAEDFLRGLLFGQRDLWAAYSDGLVTTDELINALIDRLYQALNPELNEVSNKSQWEALRGRLLEALFL